jgi:threonine dehydrogenase-like Zn-dependent dehydrogenase
MKGLKLDATWRPRDGYQPTVREVNDKRALNANNIWHKPSLGVAEFDVPVVGEKEILMKVGACGICGSDITFLDTDDDGYLSYVGHTKLPVIIGHEYAGEVSVAGDKVTKFKPGDLIVAETMNWCGECMPCRSGMVNQCENLEEIGFTLNGGIGEYLVVQEKYCLSINGFFDVYNNKQKAMEAGALIEPITVAYNGIFTQAGGFRPGSNVAVFGAGPIGLASVMLAKAAGAAKILIFEYSKSRLALAEKIGATYAVDIGELKQAGMSVSEKIMEITEGIGVHMAVECTAFCFDNLPEIEKGIAVGAKVVQLGHTPAPTDFFGQHYQKKGATFYGSNGGSGRGNWEAVIRMISANLIDPSLIIGEKFVLEKAIEGIEEAKRGLGGKCLILPNA